ncbi:C4-dicarboxylate TRAP transporter substrate-binding protein [Aestuariivita sp.]|jgi:TRAP-type C4-dicarboxylate transport system substrate-binding protein|uniref:C4-dicarboxylate TRAP transporter substrate-binding protein n=1 Tax=Aestuariivita sp. TaxID=1872407 RepID=UPI00216BCF62|nr:C4-dicarboxylate TRAP transporter substrate-binding protein [Aestuariivita sp.]MCE8009555.1 TRAP transporter substrate-binding protein DctP [Aestuariivita sp.]
MMKPRHLAAGLTATALALSVTIAEARELTFAIGHPPGSYLIAGGERFADVLSQETDGALGARVFPMSLLSMAETSAGLREGLADIGAVMSTYFTAEYPHTNMILDASMLLNTMGDEARGVAGLAYAGAMAEFILTKCPECNAEFAAQNQVYTGAAGTPGYALNCTRKVSTMDELDGARLRIGGANWARWSQAIGATPVTMSGNEMLEALSQGVLDCILLSVPDVQNFGMGESVTHITIGAPGGVYVASLSNMNRDTWQSLGADERRAVMRASAEASAVSTWAYQVGEDEVLENIRAAGVEIHEPDTAVLERTAAFVEDDLATLRDTYQDQGVARAQEMLAEFRPLLRKWVDLTQEIYSAEALADLYWSELYSKVDVTTHGQ